MSRLNEPTTPTFGDFKDDLAVGPPAEALQVGNLDNEARSIAR